jgi:uncharacterized repeat protein (TIGR03803 family)
MSTGFRHVNSILGKLLRAPNKALLLMLALGTAAALHAQSADKSQTGTYSLLYSFQCSPDAANPFAGLVQDSSGNLYSTAGAGGQYGLGAVFKVTPGGTETVLHSFAGPPSDGLDPELGSLTLDAAGNLYGTTALGGEFRQGTVFKVTAKGTESVLYNFTGGADGGNPVGGVALDNAGNLYGTASSFGVYGNGVVFKLTPDGTESVLHSFGSFPTDGGYPTGNLTRDSSGDLYGTTAEGGDFGAGTVFEVTAGGTETVLHSFEGGLYNFRDGIEPFGGGLLLDASGNLYGVTLDGGANNGGVVFKMTSRGAESMLFDFNATTGGEYPVDGLARDAAGNLYGTTEYGGSGIGCSIGCGVLFELTTADQEIVLHNFAFSSSSDGGIPYGGVVQDPSGNLYGTLEVAGAYGCGAVFKYTP